MQKKCYHGLGIFWQTEPTKQKTKGLFGQQKTITQFPSLNFHHSSLIFYHSSLITQFFTSVCLHHSVSITHYFSHYLEGPCLSWCSLFFFFSTSSFFSFFFFLGWLFGLGFFFFFFFFSLSLVSLGTKEKGKKKKRIEQNRRTSKKKKKKKKVKRWSKVAAVGPSCVFIYGNAIELWKLKTAFCCFQFP